MISSILQRRQFSFLALIFQGIFVVLFGIFGRYESSKNNSLTHNIYPRFACDGHFWIWIFNVFPKKVFLLFKIKDFRYGFSAISVNLLLAAFVIQYVILLRGFLSLEFVNDAGRCLSVHCFGTYFGLAAAKVCRAKTVMAEQENFNNSEMFSMIGSLFLWIFFPSFNAATQENDDLRQRAIFNTYFAIISCTTTTFMLSSFSDHLGRFNMIHIQISTLAGGIAIGSVSNFILYPHHALIIGFMAGLISVWGHIFSIFFVLYYNPLEYGNSVQKIYPHWNFGYSNNSIVLMEEDLLFGIKHSQYIQALCQTAGLAITILISIVGGLLSGCVMNWSMLNQVQPRPSYEDKNYFLQAEFSLFGKVYN